MAVWLLCTTNKLLAPAMTERSLLGRRAWIVVIILTKVSRAYYFNLPLQLADIHPLVYVLACVGHVHDEHGTSSGKSTSLRTQGLPFGPESRNT